MGEDWTHETDAATLLHHCARGRFTLKCLKHGQNKSALLLLLTRQIPHTNHSRLTGVKTRARTDQKPQPLVKRHLVHDGGLTPAVAAYGTALMQPQTSLRSGLPAMLPSVLFMHFGFLAPLLHHCRNNDRCGPGEMGAE